MEPLTPQQELFCRYYTQNELLFGNGTLAYAEAYDYKLHELSHEQELDKDGNKIPRSSEYDKAYNVCSVEASKALRNPKIQPYITKYLNELLRDDFVDSQLAKVIAQDSKYESKVAAIREYNKLKQRIVEKIDHTTKGDKIELGAHIDTLLDVAEQELVKRMTGLGDNGTVVVSGPEPTPGPIPTTNENNSTTSSTEENTVLPGVLPNQERTGSSTGVQG